jgi:hypothetical protein
LEHADEVTAPGVVSLEGAGIKDLHGVDAGTHECWF